MAGTEVIAGEDLCEAEYALQGAIWLYGVSEEGDMFTFSDLRGFLEQAGFVNVTLYSEGGGHFINAEKI